MQIDSKVIDRFWRYVKKTNSCWLWTGYKGNKFGHGQVRIGNTHIHTHRLSWIIHRGPIPDKMCVLHDCPNGDNPACVNPDHLWLGTKTQNSKDMKVKGRQSKGMKHPLAIITDADVAMIRQSKNSNREIAILLGVPTRLVWRVRNRETWRHLP